MARKTSGYKPTTLADWKRDCLAAQAEAQEKAIRIKELVQQVETERLLRERAERTQAKTSGRVGMLQEILVMMLAEKYTGSRSR